jgi:hypothetical protein
MLEMLKNGFNTRLNRREVMTLLLASMLPIRAHAQLQQPLRQPSPEPAPPVAEIMQALVDQLIPADEFTPAASTLGVDRYLIQLAANDPLYQRLLDRGSQWLNRQSRGSFSALTEPRQRRIIDWMEKTDPKSFPHLFYRRIRYDAMHHYYGQQASWQGLGLNHPPQPTGFPGFHP